MGESPSLSSDVVEGQLEHWRRVVVDESERVKALLEMHEEMRQQGMEAQRRQDRPTVERLTREIQALRAEYSEAQQQVHRAKQTVTEIEARLNRPGGDAENGAGDAAEPATTTPAAAAPTSATCPHCGGEHRGGRFCDACGMRIGGAKRVAQRGEDDLGICPSCKMTTKLAICPQCTVRVRNS